MGDKFYALRSGRIIYRPGHKDIEGARATLARSMDTNPRRLHQIVLVVEEYATPTVKCAGCSQTFEMNKTGRGRVLCEECGRKRDCERSRNNHHLRKIRDYRKMEAAR